MNNFYVVMTDSSADLTAELVEELGLDVIPLSVNVGEKSFMNYPDEREIGSHDFYEMLRGGANAKTSAVNVDTFLNAMSVHLKAGKDILYLGFSSGLSSTYSASEIAAQELRETYPDRKILTVDTLCASLGQGLLIYLTMQKVLSGATIEEAAAFAEENRLHLCHWFTVDDLFFLKRGGRVSAATALVGSALGIKPVMHVDNEGHLINVSKARGRKNSILALVDRMEQSAIDPAKQTIFISHGDCRDDAEFLAEEVRKRFGITDITINFVGPVIGAHSGPGTLALFFLGTER
ncbi:MAG: DegV family protein [Faecousia sp.]